MAELALELAGAVLAGTVLEELVEVVTATNGSVCVAFAGPLVL